jgi:HEAT repeat protein
MPTESRTHRYLLPLIVALVVLGAFVISLHGSAEPAYQGKPLSRWIRGLEYENVNPTDKQRQALRAMGEPAVTRLAGLLETHDSAIKRRFVKYAESHANIHNRFIAPHRVIPESTYHAQAATALGEIGPSAKSAIPELMTASKSSDSFVAARATAALIKIQEGSVARLLTQLADTDSTNWFEAALVSKYLGTNAELAVPLLVSALQKSTNTGVRQYAVSALGGIARRPSIAVPALVNCIGDRNADIRRDAIDALCNFKEAKPQIVPLLLSCMQDTDNNVWMGAAFGLEDLINPEEKRTLYISALVRSLNSPDEAIRANALMFLKRNDPRAAAKISFR